ncbi:MAG: cation-transporting P-type ATPase [Alphaproteobacteria bacterium]|nr:cation-transporting P-type ATPase [Alphaproteobacteria bacterium]
MKFNGLTATQVTASRNKHGANIIPAPAPKSAWHFFVEIFRDKINLILLIMLLLFVGLSMAGVGDMYEAIGIGAVLVIISVIGVRTQLRAQKSARDLQMAVNLHYCNVLRGGKIQKIKSTDVVVGDIVQITAGQALCADGYLIDGAIAVNNSILNGESDDCEKSPVPGFIYNPKQHVTAEDYIDQNSVFAGTTVQSGAGLMRVTHVGVQTQNAQILGSLNGIETLKTSLQIQLDNLAARIGKIGSVSAVAIFAVLILTQYLAGSFAGNINDIRVVLGDLTVALTIFVAAVPEGLPFIISIIISRNAAQMARNHILPKNPQKIPAAGNLHIICTDKTGTLTRGCLSVTENFLGDDTVLERDAATWDMYAHSAVLNNGAVYDAAGNPVGGNSTDRAILASVPADVAHGIMLRFAIMRHVPFNSATKFSKTVVRDTATETEKTFVRGATEIILKHCTHYMDRNGKRHLLKYGVTDKIQKRIAAKSLRMVAAAYIDGDNNDDDIPGNMTLIAIIAMRDELRPGVTDAIGMLGCAGIQTIMITGDNPDTARAIAADCGIITNRHDIVITATEMDGRTDEWLANHLDRIKVIARATPGTKLRVVSVAQSMNKSIGMCGDGTNDAPALRRADVGFAMGDGTDVAKEAGDIIITDNNFVSVAKCVLVGRTFLHNVVSFLRFQLPINFSLVALCIAFPLIIGGEALTAVQILIINIVMDSLNSLSFGGEAPRDEYMCHPAPPKDAALLSRHVIGDVVISTLIFIGIFAVIMTPPVRAIFATPAQYNAARFMLLVIMSILNGFNIRVDGYNLLSGLRQNPMFLYVAVGVISGAVLLVSFGGAAVGVAPLGALQWGIVFGLGMMVLPLDMLRKRLLRRRR